MPLCKAAGLRARGCSIYFTPCKAPALHYLSLMRRPDGLGSLRVTRRPTTGICISGKCDTAHKCDFRGLFDFSFILCWPVTCIFKAMQLSHPPTFAPRKDRCFIRDGAMSSPFSRLCPVVLYPPCASAAASRSRWEAASTSAAFSTETVKRRGKKQTAGSGESPHPLGNLKCPCGSKKAYKVGAGCLR